LGLIWVRIFAAAAPSELSAAGTTRAPDNDCAGGSLTGPLQKHRYRPSSRKTELIQIIEAPSAKEFSTCQNLEAVMQLKDATKGGPVRTPLPLKDVLYQRRSVREFTREPVTHADVDQLVEAAIQAPSAMNEQPWSFTVVSDKALLSKISSKAKAHMLQEFGEESHLDHFRQTLSDPNFDIFYNAPALIVISAPKKSQWAVEDCAMAAENLMLAAHSMMLGTCWIGFAQRWLNTEEGLAAIGLDASKLVVAPIIIGHPKAKLDAVPRKKPSIRWI
jgi:nitroreductase